MSERPVLVTAFDPFGGEEENSSRALLALLPDAVAAADRTTISLARVLLPTQFGRGSRDLRDAIDRVRPRALISLGQASGRRALTPERVAINVDDARIPDNAGAQPVNAPIDPDGPAAYFSTLPLAAMIAAMREAGAPAQLSNTAGTFVCNHIMYVGLHHLARTGRADVPSGFIHIPDLATVDLPQAAEALVAAIIALVSGGDGAAAASLRNTPS